MKTIKVSEATPLQIDWLVAKCLGKEVDHDFWLNAIYMPGWFIQIDSNFWKPFESYSPSTNANQAFPIIERERMLIRPCAEPCGGQWAAKPWDEVVEYVFGPTPLIAAMRCFIASKLGADVEVPENLE